MVTSVTPRKAFVLLSMAFTSLSLSTQTSACRSSACPMVRLLISTAKVRFQMAQTTLKLRPAAKSSSLTTMPTVCVCSAVMDARCFVRGALKAPLMVSSATWLPLHSLATSCLCLIAIS
ncbi:MAG: hypothetical protein ACK56F_26270, partial [bacterium]